MTVDPEDIQTYAMGFWRRHGADAHTMAVQHANKLFKDGDVEGHDVWMEVAACIQSMANPANNQSPEQAPTLDLVWDASRV